MSAQRYWQKGVDAFDELISKIKTTFKQYYNPEAAPADPDHAAVQARGILKQAANDIKDTLHQTEKQVDAVLDSAAQKIAHKLSVLEKPVPCNESSTEFETPMPPQSLAAAAHECMTDGGPYCTLPGTHPSGMLHEAYA